VRLEPSPPSWRRLMVNSQLQYNKVKKAQCYLYTGSTLCFMNATHTLSHRMSTMYFAYNTCLFPPPLNLFLYPTQHSTLHTAQYFWATFSIWRWVWRS
jgi:hypothetical protein